MKDQEVVSLTARIAKSQGRDFDEADLDIWCDALSDLPFDECDYAVRDIVRSSDDFITPHRVRSVVLSRRAHRLQSTGLPEPPSGLTADEYLSWLNSHRDDIARGTEAHSQATSALEVAEQPSQRRRGSVPPLTLKSAPQDEAFD